MRDQSNGYHPELRAALEHIISSGGKRIRPVVTLLVGQMLGADEVRLINLASAIEMLHTATLVHDDLIDGSLLRRGIPTLNAEWSPAATVLAGDFIFARAAELAADTNSVTVMKIFANTLATIVTGEINQMFSKKKSTNRQNYYARIYAKTASMFVLATKAAALLSEADEKVVDALQAYGYNIGMAFQIVDDVLDFTGDQARVGKPVGSDLRQGIVTLPVIYYWEKGPKDELLEKLLHGHMLNEIEMVKVIDSIRKSGCVQQAMAEAREYIKQGVEAIMEFNPSPELDALLTLAEYVVDREI